MGKQEKIKIRKTWNLNPTEQVVQKKDKNAQENKRQLRDEALDEWQENQLKSDEQLPPSSSEI